MSTKREKKTERQTEEEIKGKQGKNRKVKLVPPIALSAREQIAKKINLNSSCDIR